MQRLISIFLLLIIPVYTCWAQDIDEVQRRLRTVKSSKAKVDSLYAWCRAEEDQERGLHMLMLLDKLADETKDRRYKLYVLRNIMRCQYNLNYSLEDLIKSYQNIERLNINSREYRRVLADARTFLACQYIYEGDFVKVIEIANQMREDNISDNYYSTMKSYEILSTAYSEMFQDSIALRFAKHAYEISKAYCTDDFSEPLSLALSVCGFLNIVGNSAELKKYTDDMAVFIERERDRKYDYEIKPYEAMCHAYNIEYYLYYNKLDSARYSVEQSLRIPDSDMFDYVRMQNRNMLVARYFMAVDRPDSAWTYISEVDSVAPLLYLKEQAKVLHALGRDAEAYEWESYIADRIAWAFDYTFSKQLTEMTVRLQFYELQEERNTLLKYLIFFGGIAALIIIGLLIYAYWHNKIYAKKIERANKTQRVFLQNMSHELRTPLNAICGFSQLLTDINMRGMLTDEEIRQYGEIVRGNTNMLSTLLNDILDVSDMESGKYRVFCDICYPNEICNKAINTVSYRCPENVKLYFTSEVEDDFEIYSDAQRSQQILINYLTNAMKHTQEGEIHVHCSLTENPGKLTFSVTDTGVGVPTDKGDLIFERFEKLNLFKQGTGLGLAICRQLATLLNGTVQLDVTYTGGARFVFIHPLKEEIDTNTKHVEE